MVSYLQNHSVYVSTCTCTCMPPGEVTLKVLDQELQGVSEWFRLGLNLDIPSEKLQEINHNPTFREIQQFRTEMFCEWMKRQLEPSWSHVVTALMKIERESLAHKVALKYGTTILYGKFLDKCFSCWIIVLVLP